MALVPNYSVTAGIPNASVFCGIQHPTHAIYSVGRPRTKTKAIQDFPSVVDMSAAAAAAVAVSYGAALNLDELLKGHGEWQNIQVRDDISSTISVSSCVHWRQHVYVQDVVRMAFKSMHDHINRQHSQLLQMFKQISVGQFPFCFAYGSLFCLTKGLFNNRPWKSSWTKKPRSSLCMYLRRKGCTIRLFCNKWRKRLRWYNGLLVVLSVRFCCPWQRDSTVHVAHVTDVGCTERSTWKLMCRMWPKAWWASAASLKCQLVSRFRRTSIWKTFDTK